MKMLNSRRQCLKTQDLILLTTLSLCLPRAEALFKSKCPEARDIQMDTCASRMGFLGDHSFKVPKNSTTMDGFCREIKESLNCLQSYSRDCLQGFTKQILMSLLKRGKQQYNLVCHDDQARRDFMSKMACLGDDKIDQLHTCMDASIGRFEHIRTSVRSEIRLPALCCSYQIFNRDLDSAMDKVCGPRQQDSPNKEGIHSFMHKVVSGTTGEFFQLVCDNHRTMAECQASDKTRDTLRKLEQVTRNAKSGKLKPKSKSLIPVLLDILDSSEPI